MKTKIRWIAITAVALLLSGWLVTRAPADLESTAELIADLQTSVANVITAYIAADAVVTSTTEAYTDASGVVVLAKGINYSNDVSAVVTTYANNLTSGLVTITKSTATPVLAGLTVNGNVDATLFRHVGGSLLSNEWQNYSNDVSGVVRAYADSLTPAIKKNYGVILVDNTGACWKIMVGNTGTMTTSSRACP